VGPAGWVLLTVTNTVCMNTTNYQGNYYEKKVYKNTFTGINLNIKIIIQIERNINYIQYNI
jgi:hypothetical protein